VVQVVEESTVAAAAPVLVSTVPSSPPNPTPSIAEKQRLEVENERLVNALNKLEREMSERLEEVKRSDDSKLEELSVKLEKFDTKDCTLDELCEALKSRMCDQLREDVVRLVNKEYQETISTLRTRVEKLEDWVKKLNLDYVMRLNNIPSKVYSLKPDKLMLDNEALEVFGVTSVSGHVHDIERKYRHWSRVLRDGDSIRTCFHYNDANHVYSVLNVAKQRVTEILRRRDNSVPFNL